jgi:hypothetical protein
MPDTTIATVQAIYRYPVKGLSAERLDRITVTPGETLPFDRAYAIENGAGRFDPEQPRHLPKINFLMLMRDERLASLRASFDDTSETLTLLRDGKQVARGALKTPLGRKMVEQFLAAYMKGELRGPPKIVSADGHSFSDVPAKCVHIINLASVRDLERVTGRPIDPLRFRPNMVIDGAPAWSEFRWLNKSIRVADVALEVFARTQRCEATNVDPQTAQRDMALPAVLSRTWGHSDFGIYAKASTGGEISEGAPVQAA